MFFWNQTASYVTVVQTHICVPQRLELNMVSGHGAALGSWMRPHDICQVLQYLHLYQGRIAFLGQTFFLSGMGHIYHWNLEDMKRTFCYWSIYRFIVYRLVKASSSNHNLPRECTWVLGITGLPVTFEICLLVWLGLMGPSHVCV